MQNLNIKGDFMNKFLLLISLLFTTLLFTACSAESQITSDTSSNTITTITPAEPTNNATSKIIKLTTTDNQTITLELNNSIAATELYNQLPLTIELKNYSNNEKIFYPPQRLSTENTPLAQSKIGTLAYYEPWGDVVIFYGDFHSNNSLYELGHVITGENIISELSGTVTIETLPNS